MNVIHAWFEQRVAQTPEATAIKCGSQSITYQKLNDCANHLALQLLQAGAKPEMCIAICLPRSIEQIIAILAVLKSGSAYVPLDSNQSSERLHWILQEIKATILVTSHSNQSLFESFKNTMLYLDSIDQDVITTSTQKTELEKVYQHIAGDNLAYVVYTSGSTGLPKGVLIEHQSIIHYCQWLHLYTNFTEKHVVDYSSNYIFDFGITNAIAPLMLGATLVICSDEIKKDPNSYLRYLENEKISFTIITPTFFKELIQTLTPQHGNLPHLKSVILGGENLPTHDCQLWLNRFNHHVIFNEYGPTETTVAVTQHTLTLENINPANPFVPIGKPGPTMQAFIFNSQMDPVEQGEIGELYIGGSCLARGYLNQPQLTEKSFIQFPQERNRNIRLYKTGDLCRQNSAGDIEYIGRIDKQIKIRGYRVELNEIEIRLRQHAGIQDAIAVVRNNQNNEPLLVAYYILKPYTTTPSFVQLYKYLLTFLPDFMIPNAFVRLDSFPRTANDKLDERALPEPLMLSSQIYKAPQTPTEQLITKIWTEEIQHCRIGMLDNFFELGGHSLLAARIIAKIAQQMGKKILLSDLYQSPTIEQLAPIVEQAPPAETRAPMVPQNQGKSLPLHDFQLLLWLNRLNGAKPKTNMVWRKRVQGPIDKKILDLALQWVLQKQEIFSYHIHLFYPLQTLCSQPKKQFRQWRETSLRDLPENLIEPYLTQHSDELFYKKAWHVKSLWISADLFYLPNDQIELQVCISHMIADATCHALFFQSLSHAYLFFANRTQAHTDHALQPYKNHIIQHNTTIKQHATAAAKFWANYLQDAGSFHFPQQYILPNSDPVSTQIALPESFVENLRQFCARHGVGINDALCAAVSLALLQCCNHDIRCTPHKIVIFTTKSTRDDPTYDHTIGCFLREDPIKLELTQQPTLVSLAKQAQQSAFISDPFQQASSLVKLAAVGKFQLCLSKNPIKRFVINKAVALLANYFPELKLDQTIFKACEVLAIVDQTKKFLININMPKEFLEDLQIKQQPTLLGLPEVPIPHYPFHNTSVKYILDIYFHRSSDQKTRYIVLNSNLTPDFQRLLGDTVASLIEHCL